MPGAVGVVPENEASGEEIRIGERHIKSIELPTQGNCIHDQKKAWNFRIRNFWKPSASSSWGLLSREDELMTAEFYTVCHSGKCLHPYSPLCVLFIASFAALLNIFLLEWRSGANSRDLLIDVNIFPGLFRHLRVYCQLVFWEWNSIYPCLSLSLSCGSETSVFYPPFSRFPAVHVSETLPPSLQEVVTW